ncbi:MAG: hypothetical protein IJY92_06995 [Alphaproteobacteria bacterium]|nr:hypothetical protein [Alphaproteobacteria bacterium]
MTKKKSGTHSKQITIYGKVYTYNSKKRGYYCGDEKLECVDQLTFGGKVYVYNPQKGGYYCGNKKLKCYDEGGLVYLGEPDVERAQADQYIRLNNGALHLVGHVSSTVNETAVTNATNRGRGQLEQSIVLPGFPLSYEAKGYFQEAVSAGYYYKSCMHRFALESGMVWTTDADVEKQYKYVFERLKAEQAVYETVVPSKELFAHFKKRTIASLKTRMDRGERLTAAENKAYELLTKGNVESFYDFAVQTGVIPEIPSIHVYDFGDDDRKEDSQVIQSLMKARFETDMALHYYLNAMDTSEDLPDLNMSGYDSAQAYHDLVIDASRHQAIKILGISAYGGSSEQFREFKRLKILEYEQKGVNTLSEEDKKIYEALKSGNVNSFMDYYAKCAEISGKSAHEFYVEVYQRPELINQGKASAFEHLFSVISRSRRWADVAHFQSDITQGTSTDSDAVASWALGVPPVTLPAFYGDELDQWGEALKKRVFYEEKRKPEDYLFEWAGELWIGMTDERNYSGLASTHVGTIRSYYQQCEAMKAATQALSKYRSAMAQDKENANAMYRYIGGVQERGIIPYFHDAVPTTAVNVLSQEMDRSIENAADATARGLHDSAYETGIASGAIDVATLPIAITIGGGVTSFLATTGVGIGISIAVLCACEKVEENRIEDAKQYIKSAISDIEANIKLAKKYRDTISNDPRMQNIRDEVKKLLEVKKQQGIATPEEEQLYQYLNEGKLEVDLSLKPSFQINEKLKKPTEAMLKKSEELLTLELEAQMLSLCVSMYEAQQSQTGNEDIYTTARDRAIENQPVGPRLNNEGEIFSENVREANLSLPNVCLNIEPMGYDSDRRKTADPSYKSAVIRSLTRYWDGDTTINRVPEEHLPFFLEHYGNASRGLVVPYGNEDGKCHALFSGYSFLAVKTSTQGPLAKRILEGNASEDDKKIFRILFARVPKARLEEKDNEEDKKKYDALIEEARKVLNKPDLKDDEVYAELLLLNLEKQRQEEVDKHLNELIADLAKLTDDKTTTFTEFYHEYSGKNPISGNITSDEYDFLQAVSHYANGEDTLKHTGVSAQLYRLFPSRDERLQKAKAHGREGEINAQFAAEKELLEDIISILEKAPDAKAVCEKMGWTYENGKIKLESIKFAEQQQGIRDVDLLEYRCCAILRAFEGYRAEKKYQREQEARGMALNDDGVILNDSQGSEPSQIDEQASQDEVATNEEPQNSLSLISMIQNGATPEEIETAIKGNSDLLDEKDAKGYTPLFYAIESKRKDRDLIVYSLVDAGIDIKTPSNDGTTPIQLAVQNKNEYAIEILCITKELSLQDLVGLGSLSHEFAEKTLDYWEKYTLPETKWPKSKEIKNLFKAAIEKDDKAMVAFLLEKEAKNLKRYYKAEIKKYLINSGSVEMLDFIQQQTKSTPLFKGQELNDIREEITQRQQKPQTKTEKFFYYLNEAVKAKKTGNEAALNSAFEGIASSYQGDDGANILSMDPTTGLSAIHLAIQIGDVELLSLLLNDPKVTADFLQSKDNPLEKTALDYAYNFNNEEVITLLEQALFEKGAVLKDYKESQIVLFLAREGNINDLKARFKKGNIDVNKLKDPSGQTVLHWLAKNSRVDFLEEILDNSYSRVTIKDFLTQDKKGKTPLDLIPEEKKKDFVLKYLKKELDKKNKNPSVITELLEQLDEETLKELEKDQKYKSIRRFIQDQLAGISQERAKVSALNPQETNAIAVLNDNAERNITTARGADGVDISYTSSRGRA